MNRKAFNDGISFKTRGNPVLFELPVGADIKVRHFNVFKVEWPLDLAVLFTHLNEEGNAE